MNVTSLFFASSSFFPVESTNRSLLPLAILFTSLCFILFSVLLPLSFFLALLSLAAAVIAFLLSFPQTQRYISINGAMLESSSSFTVFHLSCFIFIFVSIFLMHVGKSPSTYLPELVPASSFTRASFVAVVSLCRDCLLTTHSPSFFSLFHSLLTTAHGRCDEFFDCHFCICSSTSASTSWYLIYFRFPLCTVFTTSIS